ncbi:MAG: winged helix-turn-helix transcriptional regulator [Thermomicrobiales bacterium]|nr:winged helix-turn-helix transcriptional regulator [Thermomicrobiales bacterium]
MSETTGDQLVFLLIGTFRRTIDDLHDWLSEHGFGEVRPIHGFALQAIGPGAISITELGHRLGVSKQAAAKTVKVLAASDLIVREADPADARATLIRRSDRGVALLRASAAFFAIRQRQWEDEIGEQRFHELLRDLAVIGGESAAGDFVGWLQSSSHRES